MWLTTSAETSLLYSVHKLMPHNGSTKLSFGFIYIVHYVLCSLYFSLKNVVLIPTRYLVSNFQKCLNQTRKRGVRACTNAKCHVALISLSWLSFGWLATPVWGESFYKHKTIIFLTFKKLTMMFLGRLMRSAMVLISLKALSMARSELLMVRRFWYLELPNSSKLAAPVPCSGGKENVYH